MATSLTCVVTSAGMTTNTLAWPSRNPADGPVTYVLDLTTYLSARGRTLTSAVLTTAQPFSISNQMKSGAVVTFTGSGGSSQINRVYVVATLDNNQTVSFSVSAPVGKSSGTTPTPQPSTSGVTKFNGRTGIISLTNNDVAAVVASPLSTIPDDAIILFKVSGAIRSATKAQVQAWVGATGGGGGTVPSNTVLFGSDPLLFGTDYVEFPA